jgi:hypothetical protein
MNALEKAATAKPLEPLQKRQYGGTVYFAAAFTIKTTALVAAGGETAFFTDEELTSFEALKAKWRELYERAGRWNHDAVKKRLFDAPLDYYEKLDEESWSKAEAILIHEKLALLEAAKQIKRVGRVGLERWWTRTAVPLLIPIGQRLVDYLRQELEEYSEHDRSLFRAIGRMDQYKPSDALNAIHDCVLRVQRTVEQLRAGQVPPTDPERIFDRLDEAEIQKFSVAD